MPSDAVPLICCVFTGNHQVRIFHLECVRLGDFIPRWTFLTSVKAVCVVPFVAVFLLLLVGYACHCRPFPCAYYSRAQARRWMRSFVGASLFLLYCFYPLQCYYVSDYSGEKCNTS